GDLLITSGLGGGFPPGYPVAEVIEVRREPGQPFASVIAQTTAHLDRIREVLLVWTLDPDSVIESRRQRAAAENQSAESSEGQ
ncbi:MAG: rod shape-determining protein MreC, partial [Chromatiales bacterium]|nr:rod shape-determining protein MreC [Chromatiales bacterium]